MSPFVESLARLYRNGKVTKEKIQSLLDKNKITQIEYDYVCSI